MPTRSLVSFGSWSRTEHRSRVEHTATRSLCSLLTIPPRLLDHGELPLDHLDRPAAVLGDLVLLASLNLDWG
jgi:hypothetical protein